jgi:hypothetical protein
MTSRDKPYMQLPSDSSNILSMFYPPDNASKEDIPALEVNKQYVYDVCSLIIAGAVILRLATDDAPRRVSNAGPTSGRHTASKACFNFRSPRFQFMEVPVYGGSNLWRRDVGPLMAVYRDTVSFLPSSSSILLDWSARWLHAYRESSLETLRVDGRRAKL